MVKTKYFLEKKINNSRSLLDKVDKVHFTQPIVFTPAQQDHIEIDLDLNESNYFTIDLRGFTYANPTSNTLNVFIDNAPNEVQRFEIHILYSSNVVFDISIIYDDHPVIFPWGQISTPMIESGYKQSVFSCRLGTSFNNKKEIIIIQSKWISLI